MPTSKLNRLPTPAFRHKTCDFICTRPDKVLMLPRVERHLFRILNLNLEDIPTEDFRSSEKTCAYGGSVQFSGRGWNCLIRLECLQGSVASTLFVVVQHRVSRDR